MPKISVIVPVYKVEKYLDRCVDSVLNQTFTDFECILVDDGSPDNCGKICDEYAKKDSRIVVIHKQNGGLSDARNKGIDWAFENSDSEWLTFIDSDDWVHEKYLELLYETAVDNNVKISSCGYMGVKDRDIKDEKILDYGIDIDTPENMLKKGYRFHEYNFIHAWARLYKKELFKKTRYPFGRIHEDMYVTYKLIYMCDRIAVVKNLLYYYFQNGDGIIASPFSPERINDELEGYKEAIIFFCKNQFQASLHACLINYCDKIKEYYINFGKEKEYKKVLKEHIKHIKTNLARYDEYLPKRLRIYGFKNWIYGRDEKIENFKNDIHKIREDKGFIFSVLWAIKNYNKVRYDRGGWHDAQNKHNCTCI